MRELSRTWRRTRGAAIKQEMGNRQTALTERRPEAMDEAAVSECLDNMIAIAVESGHLILKSYRNPELVRDKGDHGGDTSPLTVADLESNKNIVTQLTAFYPRIPIISEEAALPDYDSRKMWPLFWLVDPLDGTKEFLSGNDEFTVNIALIENGRPVLGVVYIPPKDLLYYAADGRGSWKREAGKPPVRIYSSVPDLSRGLTIVESKSHPSPALEKYLKDFPVKRRIAAGSSLKFCAVAEGLADIYPRLNPTMEWDVAAGDCIYRNSARSGQRKSSLTYNKNTLKNDSFVIGFM